MDSFYLCSLLTTKIGESCPSIVSFHVPVPSPVVTVRVAVVAESRVQAPFVTAVVPVMLFVIVTVEPLAQVVPVPTKWSVTAVDCCGLRQDGDTLMPIGIPMEMIQSA